LAAGLAPSEGGKFDEALWRELISGWFPEVGDQAGRAVTWPAIAAHHDWINGQLKASVTVATIAQRLRDDHGVAVSESTVRRYVAAQFADQIAETNVTVSVSRGPVGGVRAGLAHRAEFAVADLPGQRGIRQPVAEILELVAQGASPQVRVLPQPAGDVLDERFERVFTCGFADSGGGDTGDVVADGAAVAAGVAGDRRDRPACLCSACTSTSCLIGYQGAE
jgi:hypothetical protein